MVVGINVAYAAPGRIGNIGIGFAIAASTAGRIVPQLMEGKQIARRLGCRSRTSMAREVLRRGLLRAHRRIDRGPAADSELQVDDIVIAARRQSVRDMGPSSGAGPGGTP